MKSTITAAICLAFLAALSIEGMSVRGIGMDLRCQCTKLESRRMAIKSVELFPPSAHCKDIEIIATLKGTGDKFCLNPATPWVKIFIKKMLAKKP
ncbi:hypothetical protein SKAU_G00147690 [Synaphobranchus kaupii]|uniref:Chemokine interleukin-8-like domain-containing protein n=1 Tax=Synaphobranchus kaupii TaxID=118154 RepID=A0A9Q1FTT0_SYNKA|nr:hypothetical protein SKAU_G00147690 [Synaphobranchus kaupii]